MSALQTIQNYVYGVEGEFNAMLSDTSLNFEREAGFAIQVLTSNDYITKLAVNDRQSVVNAVTNIAAIGISLNPAKKQAYLVPRKGKVCLDISYMGLIDLAVQSGSILWAQADLVYESDGFELNGFDKPPAHKRNPFAKNRGEVVGVYVVVKTHSGDYLTDCMSIDEVNAIRDRSEGWKAYIEKGKQCPWVTDFGEMAKKTVVKRAYKYWPKSDRLDKAIHHLNTDGEEGLAVIAEAKQAALDPTEDIKAALQTKTDADALQYWKDHNGKYKADLAAHDKLKMAIADHRRKLREAEAVTDVEVKNAVA